ncbi:MAG: hypothetical protein JST75_18710 [Bacteroidetes bacterium]|nr:hypothetical protein [Bacteroidota bacterium]
MKFPFLEDIILENEIALLKPLQAADANNLLSVATENKNLIQFSPAQIHSTSLLNAYIEKAIQDRTHKARYSFSIFDKKKNAYAGSTSFLNISNADERLEIVGFIKAFVFQVCAFEPVRLVQPAFQ